jgi:hypothetical protein
MIHLSGWLTPVSSAMHVPLIPAGRGQVTAYEACT